jgi:phenylalanyl-tRNA synthetase beta chain
VKYLDPNNVEIAMNRACHLIELLGAGHILNGSLDEYPQKREKNIIEYKVKNINRLLGIEVTEDEMVSTFRRLECEVDGVKKIVIAPTYRPDLVIEADLAEEVARFYGYDIIPTTLATGTPTIGQKNAKQKIEDMSKVVLESCGISEALIYSFESPKVFDKLLIPEGHPLRASIEIINPLGEDFSIMRTQSVNSMLSVLATNYSYRNEAVKLYELGKIYTPKSLPLTELPDEDWKITIGMYGDVDFFDLKGAVETLIEHFNFLDKISYTIDLDAPFLHPGRKAEILINESTSMGYIGEVHPTVLENYDIEQRAYIAVLDLAQIVKHTNMLHDYNSVPRYPAVNRDIAFLVKDDIMVQDIQKVLKQRVGI